MRKAIVVVVGILIIAGGIKGFQIVGKTKERPARKNADKITTVFTEDVSLSSVPVFIESTGILEAVEKLELYSEVQGIMLPDGGKFKEGVTFRKGQVLLGLKSNDVQAQLVAQRSSFRRLVTSVMPDLKLDFPEGFTVWSEYLNDLSVEKTLKELPKVESEQLKLFLTGKSIYSDYYNIKNAEINLSKFTIRAPFDGVLIEANVDPGTVVRQGQKLGVFIKPDYYELEVAINADQVDKIKTGQLAEVSANKNFDQVINGKVARINRTVNTESQLSSVFVKVKSGDLKNGMFMHTKIHASDVNNAIEISRSMLFDLDKVYLVEKDMLVSKTINIMHQSKNSAIVTGLNNGDVILSKIPPGAFAGMKVNIYQNSDSQ